MVNDCNEFQDEAAHLIGMNESEVFRMCVSSDEAQLGIDSPIERVLYTAMLVLARLNGVGLAAGGGVEITPQCEVGRYRVDFRVTRVTDLGLPGLPLTILVECDSQQWHERSEPERRDEKRRDRELLTAGYRVFHYTGREILDHPYAVAAEVLEQVTGIQDLDEAVSDITANV